MSFFTKLFSSFTRTERKTFIVSIVVAAFCLVAAIVVIVLQTTKSVPAVGGRFIEGMVGQPEHVNPVTAVSKTDLALVKLVYSSLPDIADTIQTSPDGKTWTVRLKENLHWQDGQKLTSDDVIFTVEAIQNHDSNSPLIAAWQGITATRSSELELQFSLAHPYAFFTDNLRNLYVLPKHLFADIPPGNWRLSQNDLKPIGSGPYQFSSYDQQSDGFINDYHLNAWSGTGGPRVFIQNFDFMFSANQGDVIKNFNAGRLSGFTATPDDLALLARPFSLSSWHSTGYYAVFWNQGNNDVLADPAVRAALALAVDRNAILAKALGGHGVPDYGPIPPNAAYAAPLTATSSSDLAAAALDAAGWHLNADGVRQSVIQKTTTTLAFTITVPDIGFLVSTAQQLQSAWHALGANVTIATDTPDHIATNQVVNRSYDALLYGNILGPSSDLTTFWSSAGRFAPGKNLSLYANTSDDNLMATLLVTQGDATRTAMFAQLQSDIVAANPAVFLYSPEDMYVTNGDTRNITTSNVLSDPSDRFREVPQWYLSTTRVLK
jgi:peptide/nickel transport system substrate-binding protein